MRALAAAAAVAALIASAGGAARAQELQRFEYRQVVMAIEARIVLYAKDEATAKAAAGAAFRVMREVDDLCSDYRPDSALMRLCSAASNADGSRWIEVPHDHLFQLLELSHRIAALSEGAFDVTCGPLTHLWREARQSRRLPAMNAFAKALSRTASGALHASWQPRRATLPPFDISDGTERMIDVPMVRFDLDGMQLDLGGIAKGWALDCAMRALWTQRIESALIEAGGDLRVSSPPPGEPGWSVTVPDGTSSCSLLIHDAALSTSGDSSQAMEIDGVRYSHVIDPRTGWPLTAGRSAVIKYPPKTFGDAWSGARQRARLWHSEAAENEAAERIPGPAIDPVAAVSDALATAATVMDPHAARALVMRLGATFVRLSDPAFTSLFDGKSLSGWTARGGHYDGDAVWTVEDSCLVGATGKDDAGGLLYTATPHTSFEFQCEVKLDYPFDSGIFVRMAPEGRGMQLTLDDRTDGEVGGLYSDGWIEHARPEAARAWKRGDWNHIFLRCTGFDMRIEAWINGVAVMDRVIPQEFGADGKPAYAPSGLIGVQVHGGGSEGTGNKVRFRDLQVRDLPVFGEPWATDRKLSPPETKARDDARTQDGWRDLLAGGLDAWEAIDGESDPRAPADYSVKDGVLAIPSSQPAGYLRTKADFGDFDLRLDVRQARMSNSGLFLRSRREFVGADGARVPAGNPAYTGCEIQLLDDWNWETVTQSKLEPWQFTGSLYGAAAPARKVLRPIGEWNTLEVLARGPRLACALNGQTLWDLDTSKLAVDPPFAQRARAGFLGLQRYAAPDVKGEAAVWLRDLFVRER